MKRMTWPSLLSFKRLGCSDDPASSEHGRTPFDSDVDRITFSGAFRRLSRKTQVHPLSTNDHVHNRMSHSLEVARVGFALGKAVGGLIADELPPGTTAVDVGTIVHAACLAHDIGNPPFGHAGESAIKEWFLDDGPRALGSSALNDTFKRDLYHYEGNAQGFRTLTQLENHIFAGGLQLTYATLATFLKYPWDVRTNSKKFSSYLSEASILAQVAGHVELIPTGDHSWCRHPLAFLVEAADDICYGIVDLEDAVELKILTPRDVFDALTGTLGETEKAAIDAQFADPSAYRVNLARLRASLFDKLVGSVVEAFTKNHDAIMTGEFRGDLFDGLDDQHPYRGVVKAGKQLAADKVYTSTRKVELELGCTSTLAGLLETFCDAALKCSNHLADPSRTVVDRRSRLVLRLLGDHSPLVGRPPPNESWNDYQCVRRALDFIGGMTDNYAVYVADQIRGARPH